MKDIRYISISLRVVSIDDDWYSKAL